MHPEPILLSGEPERALDAAAAALWAGGVVLVPTDTVYGLAALTPAAEENLFVLKGRPADRSVAVLVADRLAAESLAESVPPALGDLMDRHWPGPLTVVLPRRTTPDPEPVDDDLARRAAGEVGDARRTPSPAAGGDPGRATGRVGGHRATPDPQLGGDAGTIGVRCPDHPWLRRLLATVGPLAVTSANRHAAPTPPEAKQVLAALAPDPGSAAGSVASIAVAVDGGPCAGEASTVVAWRNGALEVLRRGPVGAAGGAPGV